MESLFYDLSEEEFTLGRKVLIWVFFASFLLGGIYVAIAEPLLRINGINPSLCLAPFGISLIVGIVAAYATIKRKDLFFLINDDKVEFRYGIFKPRKYSFKWNEMKEIVLPHKDKKIKIIFNDGNSFIINLNWLHGRKATNIRKHFFHAARYHNLNVLRVIHLPPHKYRKKTDVFN